MTPQKTMDELKKEIDRQLHLKSEVILIGPPYVVLNGNELKSLIDSRDNEIADLKFDIAEEKNNRADLMLEMNQFRARINWILSRKYMIRIGGEMQYLERLDQIDSAMKDGGG